jgi:hypothetical protein
MAFHQARISSVLSKIAEQKRRQLRLKYRISQHFEKQLKAKEINQPT